MENSLKIKQDYFPEEGVGCRREGVRVTAPGSRLRGRHARTETRGRVSSAGSSIKNTTGGGGVLKCPLSPPSTILRWLRVSPARLDSHSGPLRINQNTGLLNRPPDGARPASPAAPRSPATQTRPWETAGQGPARWRLSPLPGGRSWAAVWTARGSFAWRAAEPPSAPGSQRTLPRETRKPVSCKTL